MQTERSQNEDGATAETGSPRIITVIFGLIALVSLAVAMLATEAGPLTSWPLETVQELATAAFVCGLAHAVAMLLWDAILSHRA